MALVIYVQYHAIIKYIYLENFVTIVDYCNINLTGYNSTCSKILYS